MNPSVKIKLTRHDALIVVDMQNDFLAGGALAICGADSIIPAINGYIAEFTRLRLPIFLTRDWHPVDHRSFVDYGGIWPEHCLAGSKGGAFAADLSIPENAVIVSKGVEADREGYSAFENPDLQRKLQGAEITRLFVGGIATDYCVLHTVCDALELGYEVFLLQDAIAAANVRSKDGAKAERSMSDAGARCATLDRLK